MAANWSICTSSDAYDDVYTLIDKALEIAGSVFDTEYEKQLVNYGGNTYVSSNFASADFRKIKTYNF